MVNDIPAGDGILKSFFYGVYGRIIFIHLEKNSSMVTITIPVLKSKWKTCMVEEPSHVKQLTLNHVCEIGLS